MRVDGGVGAHHGPVAAVHLRHPFLARHRVLGARPALTTVTWTSWMSRERHRDCG